MQPRSAPTRSQFCAAFFNEDEFSTCGPYLWSSVDVYVETRTVIRLWWSKFCFIVGAVDGLQS